MRSVPRSGLVMPVTIRKSVVLPAPLGPKRPTILPFHVQVQRRQGDVVAKRFGDALGVEDGLAHGQENMSRTLSKKPRSPWSGSGWKFAESRSSSNAFVSDLLNFLGVHTFKLISRSPLP